MELISAKQIIISACKNCAGGNSGENRQKGMRYIDTLERRALDTNQGLEVPLFNFDITANYSELTEKPLLLTRPDYADWQIGTAHQNIRFSLMSAAPSSNQMHSLCVFHAYRFLIAFSTSRFC